MTIFFPLFLNKTAMSRAVSRIQSLKAPRVSSEASYHVQNTNRLMNLMKKMGKVRAKAKPSFFRIIKPNQASVMPDDITPLVAWLGMRVRRWSICVGKWPECLLPPLREPQPKLLISSSCCVCLSSRPVCPIRSGFTGCIATRHRPCVSLARQRRSGGAIRTVHCRHFVATSNV